MTTGPVGWLELHADDGNTLGDFYENVFRWEILRDPNMPTYVMFRDGGNLSGGFSKETSKGGGHIYLLCDDIDQTLKEVEAAGGKTTTPRTPISDEVGAWAQFEDPQGNVMGLFEQAAR